MPIPSFRGGGVPILKLSGEVHRGTLMLSGVVVGLLIGGTVGMLFMSVCVCVGRDP